MAARTGLTRRRRRARLQQPRGRPRSPALARPIRRAIGATRVAALAPCARPPLRQRPEGDARPVRARGSRARNAAVHSRRLLARARQGRPLVRRAGVRRGRVRRRRRQLRPVPRRDDRGDRRAMPPRGALGSRAKGRRRRCAGAAGRRRTFGRRPSGGDDVSPPIGARRASTRRRSSAASRCRACTTSRRSCCSRTTPTSGSTTPKRARLSPVHPCRCGRAAGDRRRRRRDVRIRAAVAPAVGRVAAQSSGRSMQAPLRDRRAASFQRRARLRRSRKCADAATLALFPSIRSRSARALDQALPA